MANKKNNKESNESYYCIMQYADKCKKKNGVLSSSDFYAATNKELFKNGKFHICKDCFKEYVYVNDNIHIDRFKLILRMLDLPFYQKIFDSSTIDDNETIGTYMKNIKLSFKDKCWLDGDDVNENSNGSKLVDIDNLQQTKEEKITEINIMLTEEEKKSKEDIVRLLGYNPFEEYEISDQKYLYSELVPYLDEDTLEDPYKIGVILQIVINNNQIRKANIAINNLSKDMQSMITNSKDISALADITTKWNQQNDKLSKENQIALKHRGDSGSKNSTLGSMMKNLRELGFEKAEHNYYDMKKAYGIKFSADISHQSIIDIIHFDDNDRNIIFKNQREELQKLQDKELDHKEEIRKLVTENISLKDKIKELNK